MHSVGLDATHFLATAARSTSGARGQEAMNAAWRKQATKAVQDDSVNYNRLCQQEFGIGAEYDGARPLANPKAAAKIEGLA